MLKIKDIYIYMYYIYIYILLYLWDTECDGNIIIGRSPIVMGGLMKMMLAALIISHLFLYEKEKEKNCKAISATVHSMWKEIHDTIMSHRRGLFFLPSSSILYSERGCNELQIRSTNLKICSNECLSKMSDRNDKYLFEQHWRVRENRQRISSPFVCLNVWINLT